MSPRFPCIALGVWELLLNFFARDMAYLVCIECLKIMKPIVVFFFVLLQDLRTLAQFHLSPRLFHYFMDGYMKY